MEIYVVPTKGNVWEAGMILYANIIIGLPNRHSSCSLATTKVEAIIYKLILLLGMFLPNILPIWLRFL